ncbi:MAG TPA: hypothetical protein VHX20_02110 [Terracidiphilus sp.]|jgi:hypothetical protein|nr:hypothetical protein [Terracidiphilus sp.]
MDLEQPMQRRIIGQTKSVPFSLPEYECAQFKFLHAAVGKLMKAKDSLYASIPEAPPWEGIPTTQNTMPSGEVVENKPLMIESRIVIKWDDVRSCNLDALAGQADAMAEERLSIVMPHFFRVFEKTCNAAGTGTDAGGKPFSFELYLAGLEKIELQFDREGEPILPTLVVHPTMAKQMESLPPPTEEQQQAYKDLIERKRGEFNARRRYRKLH